MTSGERFLICWWKFGSINFLNISILNHPFVCILSFIYIATPPQGPFVRSRLLNSYPIIMKSLSLSSCWRWVSDNVWMSISGLCPSNSQIPLKKLKYPVCLNERSLSPSNYKYFSNQQNMTLDQDIVQYLHRSSTINKSKING